MNETTTIPLDFPPLRGGAEEMAREWSSAFSAVAWMAGPTSRGDVTNAFAPEALRAAILAALETK